MSVVVCVPKAPIGTDTLIEEARKEKRSVTNYLEATLLLVGRKGMLLRKTAEEIGPVLYPGTGIQVPAVSTAHTV